MDVPSSATIRVGYSPVQSPHVNTSSAPVQLTFLALLNAALRSRYLIIGWALLFSTAAIGWALYKPRVYTSSVAFISQASRQSLSLAGVAAQLGVAMPSAEGATSPAFYFDLVRSRSVLGAIAESTYEVRRNSGRVVGSLDQVLAVRGKTAAQRRANTIRALKDSVSVNLNQRTGMVTFAVRTSDAQLSYRLASFLINELGRFNLERRQSQAGIERRFTQARLNEVELGLRRAEDQMEAFLKSNRGDYRGSPGLTFEAERLQREIIWRQQVYNSLTQSLEQAKIEEVRDTPVITIVEPPELPAQPDKLGLVRRAIVAFVIGGLVAFFLAILRAWYSRAEVDFRDDVAEFAHLRREALSDLRHPVRLVHRRHKNNDAAAPV